MRKNPAPKYTRHTHENNTVIWDKNGCIANFEGDNHIDDSKYFLKCVNSYKPLVALVESLNEAWFTDWENIPPKLKTKLNKAHTAIQDFLTEIDRET